MAGYDMFLQTVKQSEPDELQEREERIIISSKFFPRRRGLNTNVKGTPSLGLNLTAGVVLVFALLTLLTVVDASKLRSNSEISTVYKDTPTFLVPFIPYAHRRHSPFARPRSSKFGTAAYNAARTKLHRRSHFGGETRREHLSFATASPSVWTRKAATASHLFPEVSESTFGSGSHNSGKIIPLTNKQGVKVKGGVRTKAPGPPADEIATEDQHKDLPYSNTSPIKGLTKTTPAVESWLRQDVTWLAGEARATLAASQDEKSITPTDPNSTSNESTSHQYLSNTPHSKTSPPPETKMTDGLMKSSGVAQTDKSPRFPIAPTESSLSRATTSNRFVKTASPSDAATTNTIFREAAFSSTSGQLAIHTEATTLIGPTPVAINDDIVNQSNNSSDLSKLNKNETSLASSANTIDGSTYYTTAATKQTLSLSAHEQKQQTKQPSTSKLTDTSSRVRGNMPTSNASTRTQPLPSAHVAEKIYLSHETTTLISSKLLRTTLPETKPNTGLPPIAREPLAEITTTKSGTSEISAKLSGRTISFEKYSTQPGSSTTPPDNKAVTVLRSTPTKKPLLSRPSTHLIKGLIGATKVTSTPLGSPAIETLKNHTVIDTALNMHPTLTTRVSVTRLHPLPASKEVEQKFPGTTPTKVDTQGKFQAFLASITTPASKDMPYGNLTTKIRASHHPSSDPLMSKSGTQQTSSFTDFSTPFSPKVTSSSTLSNIMKTSSSRNTLPSSKSATNSPEATAPPSLKMTSKTTTPVSLETSSPTSKMGLFVTSTTLAKFSVSALLALTTSTILKSTTLPVLESMISPVWESTTSPVLELTTSPVSESTTSPVLESTTFLVLESTTFPVLESTTSPVLELTTSSFPESATSPVLESTTSPVLESTTSPVLEATTSPVLETTTTPVLESTTSSVLESTTSPVLESTTSPVLESTTSPVLESTTSPVLESTTSTVLESTTSPVLESTTSPVLESTTSPVLESTTSPVLELTTSPVLESTTSPVLEATTSPVLEATTSLVLETTTTPVLESTTSSVLESTTSPVLESTTSPVLESTTSPVLESTTSTVLESTTSPVLESTTSPVLESTTSPVLESTTSPVLESTTSPVLESTTSSVLESTTSPVLEATTSPVLESTTSSVLESTTSLVLKSTTSPVLEPTTSPVLELTTSPVLESTTFLVLESTTFPVLESTTSPVLELTTSSFPESATSPVLESTTSPVLESTTSPVLESTTSPVLESTTSPVLKSTTSPVLELTASPVLESTTSPVLESTTSPVLESTTSLVLESTISPVLEPAIFVLEPPTSVLEPTTSVLEPTTSVLEPPTSVLEPPTSVLEPTTYVLEPTTSVLEPTTSVLEPTTYVLEPTTSVLEPTTSVLEPTTSVLKRTTSVLEPTTSVLEPTTSVLEPTTSVLEPTTSVLEPTTSVLEPTTFVLEPTTFVLEPTTSVLEPTTSVLEPTTSVLEPTTSVLEPTISLVSKITPVLEPTTFVVVPSSPILESTTPFLETPSVAALLKSTPVSPSEIYTTHASTPSDIVFLTTTDSVTAASSSQPLETTRAVTQCDNHADGCDRVSEVCATAEEGLRCECRPGYFMDQTGDCLESNSFLGKLKIDALVLGENDVVSASFTPDLKDTGSVAFRELADQVQYAVNFVFGQDAQTKGAYIGCKVLRFSSGSIVVELQITLDGRSSLDENALQAVLAKGTKDGAVLRHGGLVVAANSIVVSPLNECTEDLHDCSEHATCLDLPRRFTCTCIDGYRDLYRDLIQGRYCQVDDGPEKRSPMNRMLLVIAVVLAASVFVLAINTILIAVIYRAFTARSTGSRTAKSRGKYHAVPTVVPAPRKISDAFLAGGDVETGVWCPGAEEIDSWSIGSSSSTGPESKRKEDNMRNGRKAPIANISELEFEMGCDANTEDETKIAARFQSKFAPISVRLTAVKPTDSDIKDSTVSPGCKDRPSESRPQASTKDAAMLPTGATRHIGAAVNAKATGKVKVLPDVKLGASIARKS